MALGRTAAAVAAGRRVDERIAVHQWLSEQPSTRAVYGPGCPNEWWPVEQGKAPPPVPRRRRSMGPQAPPELVAGCE